MEEFIDTWCLVCGDSISVCAANDDCSLSDFSKRMCGYWTQEPCEDEECKS